MNVYTSCGGGFGDAICNYLSDGQIKYFKFLKENGFKPQIIHLDYSHNIQSMSLHELNPYYKAELKKYKPDHWEEFAKSDLLKIEDLFDGTLPSEMPLFYLTDKEYKFVESIPKPYITIHPGAGDKLRCMSCWVDMDILIKKLLKISPVVLLGGGNENYGFKHANLYNVINIWNGRTQCELIKHCNFFIGSLSCYANCALYLEKEMICTVSADQYDYLRSFSNERTYIKRLATEPYCCLLKWNDCIEAIVDKLQSSLAIAIKKRRLQHRER